VIFVKERKVQDETLTKRWEEEGIEVRRYGVKEIEEYVKETKLSYASEKSGDVKLWASKECSWALQEACKPVSPPKSLSLDTSLNQSPTSQSSPVRSKRRKLSKTHPSFKA
jgi:hypothetical protein